MHFGLVSGVPFCPGYVSNYNSAWVHLGSIPPSKKWRNIELLRGLVLDTNIQLILAAYRMIISGPSKKLPFR